MPPTLVVEHLKVVEQLHLRLAAALESIGQLGVRSKPAIRKLLPMQAGDVLETRADISALQRDVGFAPSTLLADGLGRFVEWYRQYHRV